MHKYNFHTSNPRIPSPMTFYSDLDWGWELELRVDITVFPDLNPPSHLSRSDLPNPSQITKTYVLPTYPPTKRDRRITCSSGPWTLGTSHHVSFVSPPPITHSTVVTLTVAHRHVLSLCTYVNLYILIPSLLFIICIYSIFHLSN